MKSKQKQSNINSGTTTISETKQWGNSIGIRIPKEIRDKLNLIDGTKISIIFNGRNQEIVIKKSNKKQRSFLDIINKTNLETLTKKITKKNQHHDDFVSDGILYGCEVW